MNTGTILQWRLARDGVLQLVSLLQLPSHHSNRLRRRLHARSRDGWAILHRVRPIYGEIGTTIVWVRGCSEKLIFPNTATRPCEADMLTIKARQLLDRCLAGKTQMHRASRFNKSHFYLVNIGHRLNVVYVNVHNVRLYHQYVPYETHTMRSYISSGIWSLSTRSMTDMCPTESDFHRSGRVYGRL